MRERQEKMNRTVNALAREDFAQAKMLFSEVFHGVPSGKNADPGMAGSLLYHMAMVTKMAAETRFLLNELNVEAPNVDEQLSRFYGDFVSDVDELTRPLGSLNLNPNAIARDALSTDEKIALFNGLAETIGEVENKLNNKEKRLLMCSQVCFMIGLNVLLKCVCGKNTKPLGAY